MIDYLVLDPLENNTNFIKVEVKKKTLIAQIPTYTQSSSAPLLIKIMSLLLQSRRRITLA